MATDVSGKPEQTGGKAGQAGGKAGQAGGKAEQAGDSKSLELLARGGLIAYGLVHLLIGWAALQIAWGGSAGGSADSSGALATLAAQPFGRVLLWLVAVGLAALAVWQVSVAIWGYRHDEGVARVWGKATSAAKAGVYTALGASAGLVALGTGSSSSDTQQRATSGVLGWPGGQVIVVAAGLIIIGVGVAMTVQGARRAFVEEIDTASMSRTGRTTVTRIGQVGYVAKGLALVIVGALLGYAVVRFDPSKAQGLDGAVQEILAQPFGKFLLTAVALGFIAYAVFAALQARYRRM